MQLIRIGGAVLNQTPLAWEANATNILAAIEAARAQGVSILCLPELCITGYGCEDMFYAPGVQQTAIEILESLLPHTQNMVVSFGLPLRYQNRIFNTACLVANGQLLGFVAKQFLPGDGIHYEPRWFTPWQENTRGQVELFGKQYPIGDIIFHVGGVKIGFEICEDAWVSGRPGTRLHKLGVDLVMNPSASHFAFDKLDVRKRFVLEGSRAFGCSYIYANLSGNEAGRAIYDGGTLIASAGNLKAVGERLSFHPFQVTSAVVDMDLNRLIQSYNSNRMGSSQYPFAEIDQFCIPATFQFPALRPENQQAVDLPWEFSPYKQEEEFSRAVALGLFDYMRKSYSKGFVISLSGGADSSAILSLCYLMVTFGVKQLGLEGFKRSLAYFREIQDCGSVAEIMEKMVTVAYQPTENSGEVTRQAAKGLAQAVNATYYELQVNTIFKGYKQIISESLGRPLTWEQDDITLQNVQARVRSPSVWMLANIRQALLLSTSNRSEAAVGYATMDGDTSGGLSPIAGIDKAFLRQWLRWLETEGVEGSLRIPALHAVNIQAPTAELRPPSAKQTDEDDLMPYDLLDSIEEAAIRDKKMPLECYQLLRMLYPQYGKVELKTWVTRFFRLWCRNQWKRERYAPSFHLDDKNLDPKTWCRFPILNGGFERELAQLARYEED
jgi:NAD+ synthase (glutamine-hydrolysing)